MSKDSKTGQRTHLQTTPTKIIVERHYVGTEKMETEKGMNRISGKPLKTRDSGKLSVAGIPCLLLGL